jgi:hypothetical protein
MLGSTDLRSLGDQPLDELTDFAACQSPSALEERFSHIIGSEVAKLRSLVAGADAFDLLEVLRVRELPVVPVAALQFEFDGSAALIELVAVLLRSRDDRKSTVAPASENQLHAAIPRIHRIGTKLLRLSTYRLLVESRLHSTDPLAELAATYQSGIINVRAMQYSSLHDRFNNELFGTPVLERTLREVLGFTCAEFLRLETRCTNSIVKELQQLVTFWARLPLSTTTV